MTAIYSRADDGNDDRRSLGAVAHVLQPVPTLRLRVEIAPLLLLRLGFVMED